MLSGIKAFHQFGMENKQGEHNNRVEGEKRLHALWDALQAQQQSIQEIHAMLVTMGLNGNRNHEGNIYNGLGFNARGPVGDRQGPVNH